MTSVDHHGTGCSEVLAAHLAEKRFLTGVHLLVPLQAIATDRRKPCRTHRTEMVKVLLQVKTKGKSSCTHHTRKVFGQCGSSCVSTYTSYYWSRNKPWLKCCFTSTEIVGLLGTRGSGVWRWGEKEIIYLSLHCHHQNDYCIKMGSDESHVNVSVGSDGQSHKTVSTNHNLFEEKGESKWYRTEVLPLTSLAPHL